MYIDIMGGDMEESIGGFVYFYVGMDCENFVYEDMSNREVIMLNCDKLKVDKDLKLKVIGVVGVKIRKYEYLNLFVIGRLLIEE